MAEIARLLDVEEDETANTSMRIPVALREAAALAVTQLGAAGSVTELATAALRSHLQGIVMDLALEADFDEHPELRPSLAELAQMAAEMDGHPLARRPDVLARAAGEIVLRHPSATADEVLLWAEALTAGAA